MECRGSSTAKYTSLFNLYLRYLYCTGQFKGMVSILTTVLGVGVGSSEGTAKAWVVESPIAVEGDAQLGDVGGGDDRNV